MNPIVKDCRTCGTRIQLVRRADRGVDGWDALECSVAPALVRDKRRSRVVVGGYSWRLDTLIHAVIDLGRAHSHTDAERQIRHHRTFAWHALHRCIRERKAD